MSAGWDPILVLIGGTRQGEYVCTYVRMNVCSVSGRSEEGYAENVSPGSMVIVMECCTYDQEISFL